MEFKMVWFICGSGCDGKIIKPDFRILDRNADGTCRDPIIGHSADKEIVHPKREGVPLNFCSHPIPIGKYERGGFGKEHLMI